MLFCSMANLIGDPSVFLWPFVCCLPIVIENVNGNNSMCVCFYFFLFYSLHEIKPTLAG